MFKFNSLMESVKYTTKHYVITNIYDQQTNFREFREVNLVPPTHARSYIFKIYES